MKYRIQLTGDVLARVGDLALHAHPAECWGLLWGPEGDDRVERVEPVSPQRKGPDHLITGDDLVNLAMGSVGSPGSVGSAGSEGPDSTRKVKAVFHSHVGSPPVLSERDRALMIVDGRPAYPVAHLVVQVSADGRSVPAARLFAWDEQRKDYLAGTEPDLPTQRPNPTSGGTMLTLEAPTQRPGEPC